MAGGVARAHRGGQPQRPGADCGDRTPGPAMRANWPTWSSTSSTTRRAICWRSATTSASAAGRRASTTCWRPKRACASFVAIAQGQLPQEQLVRAGPPADDQRRRAGAAVLERLDVRVPDAAAGHADLREHAARPDLPGGGASGRSSTAGSAACPGASRSRATTRSTSTSTTSTARSACPAWASSAAWPTTWSSRPMPSALALMVAPEAACQNLQRLAAEGLARATTDSTKRSTTRRRGCRAGRPAPSIRSFMAHHQGMSLLSLAYLLLDRPMQRRFEADPLFQATDLVAAGARAQGRRVLIRTRPKFADMRATADEPETPVRVFTDPDTPMPEVHLLSNGRYHVMVTNAGGGYSRWKDLAVTRWREDATRDGWGTFCYLRDVDERRVLVDRVSADAQTRRTATRRSSRRRGPSSAAATAIRHAHRDRRLARGRHRAAPGPHHQSRSDAGGRSRSPATRRWCSPRRRGRAASGVQQPVRADRDRPRAAGDPLHAPAALGRRAVAVDVSPDGRAQGATVGEASYETDRALHRPRATPLPTRAAMDERRPLSDSAGLGARSDRRDPPVGSRCEPDETVHDRHRLRRWRDARGCLGLVEKYQDPRLADRVFDLAWTHSQVVLRQLNATEADAQLYGRLAGSVIYANPRLRANASVLLKNRRGQSGLWGYGISGDLPIVLLRIGDLREHRAGAPARAGACLLAPEGAGRRSGDLERGSTPATARCCRTRSWA